MFIKLKKKRTGNWEVIYIGKGKIEQIPISGDIEIGATTDLETWTNQDIVIGIIWPENAEYYKRQVSIDGGSTWKEYTGVITIEENTEIIAKVEDNAGNEIKKATLEISKIDKENPTVIITPNGGTGYVMPTNGTEITGNATIKTTLNTNDEGGSEVATRQYAWTQGEEPTSWINFTEGQEIAKTDITKAGSWYLWTNVLDTAGNRATTIQKSEAFVVEDVTIETNAIKLSADKTDWTKGPITVTATYGSNLTPISLICTGTNETDYTINGTTSVEVKTNNQTVTAKAQDKAGNIVSVSLTINKIDPNDPIVTSTTDTVTIYEKDSYDIATYFDIVQNGDAPISKKEYINTSDNNNPVSNTTSLSVGTHIIQCTVDKENGGTDDAIITILVDKPLITIATDIQTATKEYQDAKGNKIVVPGGFKVRTDLATTVDQGIVIEDSEANQFVWVPIGTITKADGTTVMIELGRYTFASNGTPTLKQSADNYDDIVTISSYYQELAISRTSTSSTTNTTALNLEQFIDKTILNGGYYIGRFEATSSSTGGSKAGVTPATQMVQPTAANAARAMYSGNSYVVSDLVNSYMWDTAIVFIQKCSSKTNYARATDVALTFFKTGDSSDVVCNIYDMCGNLCEWTTEYSTWPRSGVEGGPCGRRGSYYEDVWGDHTAYRYAESPTYTSYCYGFRVGIYVL